MDFALKAPFIPESTLRKEYDPFSSGTSYLKQFTEDSSLNFNNSKEADWDEFDWADKF